MQPHSTQDSQSGWMSTREVADHLGLTRWTVNKLRKSGDLPYHRHGDKVIRYRRDDVEAYEAATRVDLTNPAPHPLGRAERGRRTA